MKRIEKFEDLEVWQNGIELSILVYDKLRECRDYAFRDQICRATVSISSNIAEGFERQSNKEYIDFFIYCEGISRRGKNPTGNRKEVELFYSGRLFGPS